MVWRAGVVAGLVACTGQSGETPFIPCPTVDYVDVASDDAQLGFTAEEVAAALVSPEAVTWAWAQDKTWIDTTLELTMTGFAVDGQVQIADYRNEPASCELQGLRELVVPVGITIDVGQGQAVATGPYEVRALGSSLAEIGAAGTWGPQVELTGDLGAASSAWWADVQARNEDWTSGFQLDSLNLNLLGPWEALEVSIEAQHRADDYVSATSLWRGPAEFGPKQ